MRRAVLAAAATALAVVPMSAPAMAVDQPRVDAELPPPDGTPGPGQPMDQRSECVAAGVVPGTDPGAAAPSAKALDIPAAWQFSRGEGETVAIVDTGVRPGPRLSEVEPGGDYVADTDGLVDCDGHGTLVAGVIAGQPGDDQFAGVAPAARLLALRATSAAFSPQTPSDDPMVERVSADIDALARAIVRAADLGARVITVPTVTCLPADRPVDQAALGAALRHAVEAKDAVVVAAAGDVGRVGGGTPCDSNPLTDLTRPADPRNWAATTSVSVPSWWQPYVLSVGSLTAGGQPSTFTMAGPWVGVAAPGENIASVSNRDDGGLANGLPGDKHKLISLNGTGYAAGYVSGIAALIRSKYPGLAAGQVVERITATAHNAARQPSNLVGAGTVDAVAALTWQLPADRGADTAPTRQLPAPPEPAAEDPTPRVVAYAGTGVLALVVIGVAATAARRRKEPTS